jgi:hypothetical protein
MKYRIKNTDTTIKIIAIYQILGGVVGLIYIIWLLLGPNPNDGLNLLIYGLVAFVMFSIPILSGILLLQGSNLKKGLVFSSIAQALQVIAIIGKGYIYEFYSGGMLMVGIEVFDGFEYHVRGGISSGLSFGTFSEEYSRFIKLNVLALIILLVLINIYKEKYVRGNDSISDEIDIFGTIDSNETASDKPE